MALDRKYMDTDTGGGTRSGTNTSIPVKVKSPYSSSSSSAKKPTATPVRTTTAKATKATTPTTTPTAATSPTKKTYSKSYYRSYGSSGGGPAETPTPVAEPNYTSKNWNNYLKLLNQTNEDAFKAVTNNAQTYQDLADQNIAEAEAQYNTAYNTNKAYYDQLAAQNAQREAAINNAITEGYDAMLGNANEYYNNLLGTYNRSMDYINQGFNEGSDTSQAIRDEAQRLAQELYNMGEQTQNRQTERDLRGQYISYMNGLRNLEQRLAAQGINGGMTETSRLNALNGYEANRTDLEEARLAGLAQLRQQQMQSDSEAEQAYLNAMADLIANRTQNYLGAENTRASGEQAYTGMKNDAESNRSSQVLTAQNNFQNWLANLIDQRANNENQYANAKYNLSNSKNDAAYNSANMKNQAASDKAANYASTAYATGVEGVGKAKASVKSTKKKTTTKSTTKSNTKSDTKTKTTSKTTTTKDGKTKATTTTKKTTKK